MMHHPNLMHIDEDKDTIGFFINNITNSEIKYVKIVERK